MTDKDKSKGGGPVNDIPWRGSLATRIATERYEAALREKALNAAVVVMQPSFNQYPSFEHSTNATIRVAEMFEVYLRQTLIDPADIE